MRFSTALAALSVIVSLSLATNKTSTVTIPFISVIPTDLALSVVTAAPSSTVYAVGCALDSSGSLKNTDCAFTTLTPWMTIKPSYLELNISLPPNEIDRFPCAIVNTTLADCSTITEITTNGKTTKITQSAGTESVTLVYGAATITAGLDKLQAAVTPTSGMGSASAGTTSSTSTNSASTGSTSNAAAARETARVGLLAVAGVAGAGLLL